MKHFFSALPIRLNTGLLLVRSTVALLLIYHGWEVFNAVKMQEYIKWEIFKANNVMPYAGKSAELISGILLLTGLFTRLACIFIIVTFGYITFFIGNGKFWYEDQHPFLFALLGLFFFFTGPGTLSLDSLFFKETVRK